MARLGELLVAAGKISPAQLDEGLRAQVLYGGRLGTNLVELFHLDLDAIALALARQHGVPAALGKHFERCDLTVQRRLPREVAERWAAVPIGRLAHARERIAIASCDPLPPAGRAELADAMRCAPEALVVSIAAELRIRYYLERAFDIRRPSRYLRVRRSTQHEIPVPPPVEEDEASSDPEIPTPDAEDSGESVVRTPTPFAPHPKLARAPSEADEEPTIARGFAASKLLDDTPAPPEIELDPDVEDALVPERKRRFVRTLSDADVDVVEPAPPDDAPAPAEARLARIAIRKVSQPVRAGTDAPPADLEDAARAIRRAGSRDKVGDLIVRTLLQHDGVAAAAVFVVREPIAIGWKGEVRGAAPALDRIAIPLDEPNAVARAFQRAAPERLDCAAGATALDQRLWAALGGDPPDEATIAPVLIGGHPVCLVYAHGAELAGAAAAVAVLAEAASVAFVRLLRAAQR